MDIKKIIAEIKKEAEQDRFNSNIQSNRDFCDGIMYGMSLILIEVEAQE